MSSLDVLFYFLLCSITIDPPNTLSISRSTRSKEIWNFQWKIDFSKTIPWIHFGPQPMLYGGSLDVFGYFLEFYGFLWCILVELWQSLILFSGEYKKEAFPGETGKMGLQIMRKWANGWSGGSPATDLSFGKCGAGKSLRLPPAPHFPKQEKHPLII